MEIITAAALVALVRSEPGKQLVAKVFGPIADALGQDIGLVYRSWVSKNLEKIINGTARRLIEKGTNPEPVPSALMMPLLFQASRVEEEALQEMFAELLANAGDPQAREDIHPAFGAILTELSPRDAEFASWLNRNAQPHRSDAQARTFHPLSFLTVAQPTPDGKLVSAPRAGWTQADLNVTVSSLQRHQLIAPAKAEVRSENLRNYVLALLDDEQVVTKHAKHAFLSAAQRARRHELIVNPSSYHVTTFGARFLASCLPPGPPARRNDPGGSTTAARS